MSHTFCQLLIFIAVPACLALQHVRSDGVDQRSQTCRGTLDSILGKDQASTQELLDVCREHYPEGVCLLAQSELNALPLSDFLDPESGARQASTKDACNAVEAAWSSQRALLQRQLQLMEFKGLQAGDDDKDKKDDKDAKSDEKGDDKDKKDDKDAASDKKEDDDKDLRTFRMDASLQSKWLPVPHGRFGWEYKTKGVTELDKLVIINSRNSTDTSDPLVQERAKAFESYATTSAAPKADDAKDDKADDKKDDKADDKKDDKADDKKDDKKSFMQVPPSMPKISETLKEPAHTSLLAQHRIVGAHKPKPSWGDALFQASRVNKEDYEGSAEALSRSPWFSKMMRGPA